MLAAMELFVKQDVQATPMSLIAKMAKTGMGTIYNYFSTKEELINAIFIYIKLEQQLHVGKTRLDLSLQKQFEHYYLGFNQYWLKHPMFFFFIDQFERSPVIAVETRKKALGIVQPVTDLIRQGQHEGKIKKINAEELIEFLNGGIHAFIRWVLTNKMEGLESLLKNQLGLAWDAIKT